MLPQKMQMRILLMMLALFVHGSAASAQHGELDSIGRMPEITVTATRYEHEDDAWLGMVEGIVVEAQKSPKSRQGSIARDDSQAMNSGQTASEDIESSAMNLIDPRYLIILSILVLISIAYVVIRAFLSAGEAKNDGTEY